MTGRQRAKRSLGQNFLVEPAFIRGGQVWGISRFCTSGSAQYSCSRAEGQEATIQPLLSTGCSGWKISSRPRKTSPPSEPRIMKPLWLAEELLKVPLSDTVKPSFP